MGNLESSISNESAENSLSLLGLIHEQKWDDIQNLAKERNSILFEIQSMLPIHYAFKKGASLPVIKVLHEAYIENIKTSFNNNSSYYNYLITTTNTSNKVAPKKVIEFLHKRYPQGIETRTSEGNLLIHTACYNNASLDIIQYLLYHYPKGIFARNYYGRLPIHCACSVKPNIGVIRYLCKMHPRGIDIADNYGDYPIDIAFHNDASNDVVDYLSNFNSGMSMSTNNIIGYYSPILDPKYVCRQCLLMK